MDLVFSKYVFLGVFLFVLFFYDFACQIYTAKIFKSVNMYVCTAMPSVVRSGMELKLCMRVEDRPTRFETIFPKRFHQSCWQKCSAMMGSKVMQGQLRSTGGQNAEECAMPYGKQIWWEESLTGKYFPSDPTKGQRSSRAQVALEILYGHQIW